MSAMFKVTYFADIAYWLICPWGCHTSYYFPRAFTLTLCPILKYTYSGGVVSFFLQHIYTHKISLTNRWKIFAYCSLLSRSTVFYLSLVSGDHGFAAAATPERYNTLRSDCYQYDDEKYKPFVHKLCFGIETSRVVEWVYQELCAVCTSR